MQYFLSFSICMLYNFGHANRVFERIYDNIQSDMACFKRFNGTHEVGCTSGYWGNVGIIHIIYNAANLSWVLDYGPNSPYVLVLIPELFTYDTLQLAGNSGKVSGVILLDEKEYKPFNFSNDQMCPNKESSVYINTSFENYCAKNPWNPYGSSILMMNWDFPIFLVNEKESIQKLMSCYSKFNKPGLNGEARDWPLCAIELDSNMYATTNSEVCLRRSKGISSLVNLCDPLEDINIWGSILPFNNSVTTQEDSIIIVSTSGDSASLFDNISPGADAAITGLVTLLATAEALFRYKKDFETIETKNVMFIVFEGETWDYIGSSKVVYDMIHNKFPYENIENQEDQLSKLNLSHIHSIIDFSQVGLMDDIYGNKKLYLHTDPVSNLNQNISERTNNLTLLLNNESKNWTVEFLQTSAEIPLPPSSFQSFLKHYNISGTVITDYENAFKNRYFTSIYDNADNVNYPIYENGTDFNDLLHKDIADVASTLASSLYYVLTKKKKSIEADKNITSSLLYCFLHNMNCTYFQENSDERFKNYLKPEPAKTYISVKRADNILPSIVFRILSRYMGEKVEINETDCKSNNSQIFNLIYFPYIDNGTCYQTTVHQSNALSPAFIIENYSWKSNEYSTWTESTWGNMDARIFLRPSPSEEIGLLIGGWLSVLLSVVTVYFLSSRADIIFDFAISPTPC